MAKKILIIEDEEDLAMMVQARLEVNGYQAEVMPDGETGLEKIKVEPPDLIILDIVMPGLDGYQVCRQIKTDASVKHIPIIVLTASGQKDAEDKCLAMGAACCMRKPFDPAKLLGKVKELIG